MTLVASEWVDSGATGEDSLMLSPSINVPCCPSRVASNATRRKPSSRPNYFHMARPAKVRVLMAGGKLVEPQSPPIESDSHGIRLEVGAPVWTEVVKQPESQQPFETRRQFLATMEVDKPEYGWSGFGDPEVILEDPRDVPLWKPTAFLHWALWGAPWKPEERTVLQALWFESGDVRAVSEALNLERDKVRVLLNRARSVVRHAARWRGYEEDFAAARVCPGNWHRVAIHPIENVTIWFLDKIDGPLMIDWTDPFFGGV